ncbi:MAG: hypothetical protein ACT4PE_02235 [Candidatus Eiseniibacteriota bacterium]
MSRAVRMLLALAAVVFGPEAAVSEEAGTAGSAGAAADSAVVARTLVSTDGAIAAFEEAVPGEGIKGFWWEYDAAADLARLLDENRREERLEPIVDPFGFELAIPDTILALRDSVSAVADSILAERIDIAVSFDPKFTSTYDERKDQYVLKNEFTTSYPVVTNGTLTVDFGNSNEYNESTGKVKDGRRVSSTFTYLFQEHLASTFSVNWNEDRQERERVVDADTDGLTVSGQLRETRAVGLLGDMEAGAGLSVNRQRYTTSTTDGESGNLTPDWRLKLTRAYTGGTATMDYTGSGGVSSREERRTLPTGVAGVDSTIVDESDDTNINNTVNLGGNYKFEDGTELRLQSSYNREQVQYLSQADSLRGQQESRVRDSRTGTLSLTTKPVEGLEVRANADYSLNDNDYRLTKTLSSNTSAKSADTDISYEPWEGGRWTFKMERSAERRDYQTPTSGDVSKQQGSVDFKQKITTNVDFDAAYFVSLDRFEFDDPLANVDRDVRTQRGTFTVRYNPAKAVTSAITMQVRKTEFVNIHPVQAANNNTDHGYTINPMYTWRLGAASLSGDVSVDARYKVQDFQDDANTLVRRLTARQKWQQALSSRLSTEVQYRWEFSDQGSYNRSELDGRRRYGRSREIIRSTVEAKLRYDVGKGFGVRVEYRTDEDDSYSVSGDDRELQTELPRRQLLYAADYRRDLLRHVHVDVNFSQTLKNGEGVTDVERNYYTIIASIVYQPFQKEDPDKDKKGKKTEGEGS